MNKALSFPFGFSVNDNTPLDGRYMFWDTATLSYRPYNGTAEVLTAVPLGVRHPGLTVRVLTDVETGTVLEYWFKDGVADGDLFEKGVATALPPQIQKANFQNLDNVFQNSGSFGDVNIYGQFFTGNPTNWPAATISDLQAEDALFDENTWDTVSPVYWFAISTTQGIYRLDVAQIEDAIVYNIAGFGTVYTGVVMGSNNVRGMYIDKVNRKLYFFTSETTAFYILDYVANTLVKKTFTASGTITRLHLYSAGNKVIVSTSSGFIIYDLTGSTAVAYTRTSANYTGDLLPASGGMGTGTTVLNNGIFWLGANTSFSAAQNQGVWKYDIVANTMTKFLNNTQYVGLLHKAGPYAFYRNVAGQLCRIELATSIIKTYVLGSYTGDTIDTNVAAFRWDERTNSLMMTGTGSTNPSIHIFNIATEVDVKYFGLIPEETGVAISAYSCVMIIPSYASFFGHVFVKKSSGQLWIFQPLADNPMSVTFDRFGMKVSSYQDANRNLISPLGVIHKKYVDDKVDPMQIYVDLQGYSKHAQGPVINPGVAAVWEIGYNSSFPDIQVKQESQWNCNLEEQEITEPLFLDFLWKLNRPKMTVFLLVVGGTTLGLTGFVDDTFETMMFLNKSSAGAEWDGVTQTLTLSGDGLYKLDFTQVWSHPKAVFTVEKFPWSY